MTLLDYGPLPFVIAGAVVGGLIGAEIDRRLRFRRLVRHFAKRIDEKRKREREALESKPANK
jgi:hypothetical protein